MSQYKSIHGDKAKAMVGCWDGVNFVVWLAEWRQTSNTSWDFYFVLVFWQTCMTGNLSLTFQLKFD